MWLISGNSKGVTLVQMDRVSIHGEPNLSFEDESKRFKGMFVERGLVIGIPFTG
jgi:hypothetical protein